mmetsp:Transcript_1152/g.3471  ORF Transcript_1152/g.3471 Transcript_1152/m.3471 type:complete len:371 (-) Transcript_1152:2134-3246(-)|eukprot:CAMPEP_0206143934 /NCGR_PEP_ID=MMETSP1473-20131121/22420_1 /ASSEMBLY_ACC=CAM_ASM_001109 /TAXON_ID=1461547 /ORGANISM="Stichococcus sp, Strain RCC1054" /LENGTH=370 /DNA_ID=CAMNT_0053539569 /DNA_START=109 /DNA_END=1221 /DNA_ORIENTATION=-
MTMAALMESAILLGRDASVNLGVKTATVAAAHSGLPDSGDWLIVSVAEAEAPEDATTASKTSQASVPNTALPSPMAAIAVPSDGAVAASITAGTLKTSTLELGVPVSTKKPKTPRTRRGNPKGVLARDAGRPAVAQSAEILGTSEPSDAVSATVPDSAPRKTTDSGKPLRVWNPFARLLGGGSRQKASAHILDLAPTVMVEGADSDGVMYPSAAKPATTAPPRGVVSLTATAVGRPLGPLSDNGSVPDIDAVTATGTIPCPVGGTWLQTPATPVKAVPAAALQECAKQAVPDYDTAQEGTCVTTAAKSTAKAAVGSLCGGGSSPEEADSDTTTPLSATPAAAPAGASVEVAQENKGKKLKKKKGKAGKRK